MRLPQTERCYRKNFLIGFTKQKCHNNKTQADWNETKHLTKENLKNEKKKNRNVFVLMLLYL